MRMLLRLVVTSIACWAGGAGAQTMYAYAVPYGTYISAQLIGFQASTTNAGYLDFTGGGLRARDAPHACLNDVYYYDLTTPFGQALQNNAIQLRYNWLRRLEFTKNPDGRCWLTLVQYE